MDGHHRLGGIELYTKTTSTMLNVPFLAFHWLDEDEEIKFFDIINIKAKGLEKTDLYWSVFFHIIFSRSRHSQ
ncbi:hypothetical protein FC682_08065 [Peribacillus simplex]|uniref:hypothetical protein n=1 Tax=Peribacillus simplex TaxID=1478 RepID=UPI0010BEBBC5|nr:hypothetical protein [Peribacillus simplex]TKH05553.1 hypothetical protein FC682_08065 [Peribacillus simplex]